MCRWGCATTDTTYMCKWCGTRFCKACKRGEFGTGFMKDGTWCWQCNQKKCLGKRVEYVPSANKSADGKSARSRSSSRKPGKSSKSTSKSNSNKGAKKKKGKKKK
ncbi:uncharacterized protein [Watersipora subatra]|uniref:uncharacterized protein n=1 Tax=Watersipora subatra TaxID=2589382 RepID=UPI00355BB378